MTRDDELNNLLEAFNREDLQESGVDAHDGSFFDAAPNDETMRERAREFDDVHKHWVRRSLWLKFAERLRKEKGAGLRLLTLPGRHLFEVKLYAKNNLLDVYKDAGGDRFSVVAFESDPTVFGLLKTSDPKLLELLRGDVLSALTDPRSPNGTTLRRHAPYDIINLDLTANIATTSDGPYSPFLQGIHECFSIQGAQPGPWALLVTFRSGMMNTEPKVISQLEDNFQANIDAHVKVRELCIDKYDARTASELLAGRPEEGLGQFTGKWIIEQGHQREWECTRFRHASYRRSYQTQDGERSYSLRKLAFLFTRRMTGSRELVRKTIPVQAWHIDDLARLFDPAAQIDVDEAITRDVKFKTILEAEIEELRSPDTNGDDQSTGSGQ